MPVTSIEGKMIALKKQAEKIVMTTCAYGAFNDDAQAASILSMLDTSNVTNMTYMFYRCTSLTTVPLFDTSNVTSMYYMFYNCSSLTTVPLFDTSNVTNMGYMFLGCNKLISIPALDVSKVTNFSSTFYNCTALTSLDMYGSMYSLDLSTTALGHDALVTVFNNLGTAYSSTQKITIGSTKLALLTDDEKAIVTGKGYQLA